MFPRTCATPRRSLSSATCRAGSPGSCGRVIHSKSSGRTMRKLMSPTVGKGRAHYPMEGGAHRCRPRVPLLLSGHSMPQPLPSPDVRVLTVDDQKLFRQVAGEVIAATPGFEAVGEATSGEEALDAVDQLAPQ